MRARKLHAHGRPLHSRESGPSTRRGSARSASLLSLRPARRATATALLLLAFAPALASADPPLAGHPWRMHAIDDRFRGANGLGAGDVNGDGFDDYVTNYEFDQRLVIALHPGPGASPRRMWPTVVAWQPAELTRTSGVNPENAALGDFDGDSALDVVVAQGWSSPRVRFWEGSEPGVRFVWGPPAGSVSDASRWTDAGRIPATADAGHFHWVVPCDLNGDGALDVLLGGRVHGGNGKRGGVRWLEAPLDVGSRRDVSHWRLRGIDAEQTGGHGALPFDLDGDGDLDVVVANADFDTPAAAEALLWYENPGAAALRDAEVWPAHEIVRSEAFGPKPQVAIADLDGDGLTDLVTQVEHEVWWFRRTSARPVQFERVVIPKHPAAQWPSRTIRVADVNGDGRLDVIGFLMHRDGEIPAEKASVFWMEWTGASPSGEWTTHVVKWGPGRTMALRDFGEKWDLAQVVDVELDGDLDLVANDEEWWENGRFEVEPFSWEGVAPSSVSVVWFENPEGELPRSWREREARLEIEAEEATRFDDGTWVERGRFAGFSGDGYLQAHHALHPWMEHGLRQLFGALGDARTLAGLAFDETRGARYAVRLAGGEYALWLRARVPARFGYGLGGEDSDSVWVAVDGEPPQAIGEEGAPDAWRWVRAPRALALTPGEHALVVRVAERGFALDRIVLTSDEAFTPEAEDPP